MKNLKNLINTEKSHEITDDMDAQSACSKFEEIYLRHYSDAYPLKSNRIRRKNERLNPKPWILIWLENACDRRQNAYHVFVKTPSPENKVNYDKLNKFCDKHIELAKIKYRNHILKGTSMTLKNNGR